MNPSKTYRAEIALRYLENRDNYTLPKKSHWGAFVAIELATESEEFIEEIEDLVCEALLNGVDIFKLKYWP